MTDRQILKEALELWGFETQRLIWLEELGELIQVIAKKGRVFRGATCEQLEDEMADVDICLSQMKLMYPGWKKRRVFKMKNLAGLVNEAKRNER